MAAVHEMQRTFSILLVEKKRALFSILVYKTNRAQINSSNQKKIKKKTCKNSAL